MTGRGFGSFILSAGAGAIATVAGMYFAKKMKKYFSRKPKMKVLNNGIYLSTRCTWLISELEAESDFDMTSGDPLPNLPGYPEDAYDDVPMELLMLEGCNYQTEKERKDIEAKYQLVRFNSLAPNDADFCDSGQSNHDADLYDYDPPRGLLQGGGPTVPAVVLNDEFTMIEGAAICMYLADLYGQFLPPAEHKAEYYSWIVYSAATFDNIIKTLQQQMVETAEAQRDENLLDSALHGFRAFSRALSDTLGSRQFLCGKSFTAADCVLGFTLWWAFTIEHGVLLQDFPVLLAYLDRLKQRPAFQKTFCGEEDWDWSRYFRAYVRGVKRN